MTTKVECSASSSALQPEPRRIIIASDSLSSPSGHFKFGKAKRGRCVEVFCMRITDIELRCYETYYYANVIRDVLSDRLAFIRKLNDFYGDGRQACFSSPYPRFSALHSFISFVVEDVMFSVDDLDLTDRQERAERFEATGCLSDMAPWVLPIEKALAYYGLKHSSFLEWLATRDTAFGEATEDDVCDYHNELRVKGPLDDLLNRVIEEIFFVLFFNRRVLLLFNEMMAGEIQDLAIEEVEDEYVRNFARPGRLRRVMLPQWVKRAVFHRDRGLCVVCRRDLSGTLTTMSKSEYDHIVPLAEGGLNDVTNIQLLCKACNRRKKAGKAVTSDFYEAWYEPQN